MSKNIQKIHNKLAKQVIDIRKAIRKTYFEGVVTFIIIFGIYYSRNNRNHDNTKDLHYRRNMYILVGVFIGYTLLYLLTSVKTSMVFIYTSILVRVFGIYTIFTYIQDTWL